MVRNILVFFILTLPGFLNAQPAGDSEQIAADLATAYRQSYYSQSLGVDVPVNGNFLFYDTVNTWLGTPYKFAGNCEKGIDCSGFVNMIYDRVYGISLGARNSSDIYTLVSKIDKDDLQEGDLVFFRIRSRYRISHVGVYLGNQKFVHASTSKGVIISDLNEPYYRKYFAGAGRHKTIASQQFAKESEQ
jgi:murein DD-endopeptidase / murein LD-carboxypeptidase